MTLRAATYLRISLDLSGEQLGVDRQRTACRRICTDRGWSPVEYVDNSVSASKTRGPDSAYARLLDDARTGRIGAVVVWDLDRLTRRPRELEDWIDLAASHGVRLVTADGEVDTATENGRLYLRIKAAVAAGEVELKARRQREAHAQRAGSGLPPIGPRAFGWERDGMTLVPVEAELIRQAAQQLLEGTSLRAVARAWNAAGHVTAKGRPWAPYSVRGLLLNPRVAGQRARRVGRDRWELIGPGQWPAILSDDVWQALQRALTDPQRRTTPGTARVSLLSNLARCGVCGRPLLTGGTQRGVRTYKCLPVLHLSRAAEPVEEWVTTVILARLQRPDLAELVAAPAGPDLAALRRELTAKRGRLRALAALVSDGTLTAAEVREQAPPLRAAIAAGEQALAGAARPNVLALFVLAEDVRARWDAADFDVRRAVIDALATVTVHPPGRGARRFDPDTVTIDWR